MSTTPERQNVAASSLASLAYLFDEATTYFPMPGGVVSVIGRDGVLAEASFGYADLERRVPMSPAWRFEIGSISKFFTALAVNQLVDEGRLRLDETVAEVLPWLEMSEANCAASVARLLNHTSGMSVGADTLPDDAGEIWNSRACVSSSSASPHFHYSNLGYLVLGEMVRARSGRRLAEFVQEQWLGPLAMNEALAQVTQADRTSLATGYWPARPDHPWAPGDALSPSAFFEIDSASGNIAATSADMAALVRALLRASGDEPTTVDGAASKLSRALFERMTSGLAPTGEPTYVLEGMRAVQESRYAMGINVERVEGHLCVSHGG
ncbi:MAG: serine hydrolase domain-containing protein, partial [Acidimicrobiales bacterium]